MDPPPDAAAVNPFLIITLNASPMLATSASVLPLLVSRVFSTTTDVPARLGVFMIRAPSCCALATAVVLHTTHASFLCCPCH